MKAVVLERACRAEELYVSEVPVPEVKPGWVLVRVNGFGLNHSELILRRYEADAPYIHLPRIPGIECVGEIADPSDSSFKKGQRVVALMGGMGRSFDGSYAEYALLPAHHVFAVNNDMGWIGLAAIPETYFTAWGSLFESLRIEPSDTLLVHGGTSALGLAAIQLAKSIGCTVYATTRKKERFELLKQQGADFPLLDDGTLADRFRAVCPQGAAKMLELVRISSAAELTGFLVRHGTVCVTGTLDFNSGSNFDPIKNIPSGTYLTSFYSNYPTQQIMDEIFAHIRQHNLKPAIGRVFPLEKIADAHLLMEQNAANGKIVVSVSE